MPQDSHNITLTFSTKKVDTFNTYLIIENCANPHNTKMLRIGFKVVATQNTYFSVLVDGKESTSHTIDFGEVYYNQTFQDRSFVIVNDSNMYLDIFVSNYEIIHTNNCIVII